MVQALRAASIGTSDPSLFAEASRAVLEAARCFRLDRTPAANATLLVKRACQAIGYKDPYSSIKREQNSAALRLAPTARRLIEDSSDSMASALLVSCIGNVIDLGAQDSFDLEKELATLSRQRFAKSDLGDFRERLSGARRLLLIADNCGEIVFDQVFLATLPSTLALTVAVKSGPIIDDASVDDALMVGLDGTARVIPTGSDELGVDIDHCSHELLRELETADLVVAKGHANFETLNEEKMGIFFLLKAKCQVVARELGVETGSLVFVRS
jgi:uncharacterized protein with ATP-grasp and redox domains